MNYDEYWEPSAADELYESVKTQFLEHAKKDVAKEIEELRSENKELKAVNEKYRQRENEIAKQESMIAWEKKNLYEKVEAEFYKKSIEDVFAPVLKHYHIWCISHVGHQKEKCDLCDENRKLVHEFENGQTVTTLCNCSKREYSYAPVLQTLAFVTYKIHNYRYVSKKYFCLGAKYNSPDGDGTSYATFDIMTLYNSFERFKDEYEKAKLSGNYYSANNIGFATEESCQRCCDYLNMPAEEVE